MFTRPPRSMSSAPHLLPSHLMCILRPQWDKPLRPAMRIVAPSTTHPASPRVLPTRRPLLLSTRRPLPLSTHRPLLLSIPEAPAPAPARQFTTTATSVRPFHTLSRPTADLHLCLFTVAMRTPHRSRPRALLALPQAPRAPRLLPDTPSIPTQFLFTATTHLTQLARPSRTTTRTFPSSLL
jgi:hypothetical protein